MRISRLLQYLLTTTFILSTIFYPTLLMAQDEEIKTLRDVRVQRSDGKNRSSFKLILPENDPNLLSDYIQFKFLKGKPQLAKLISTIQVVCSKSKPEKNTDSFKVFSPTQRELNQGRGFRIEIGCGLSNDNLKERLALIENVLSAMQPFAKENLANILKVEITKDVLHTVESILSGDLKEPLKNPVMLCDIEWNTGAYLPSLENTADIKRIVSNIGSIFESCRDHADPERCLANSHYNGSIAFQTGKPPVKVSGQMKDGVAVGKWATIHLQEDRYSKDVDTYDEDGRIQRSESFIKDKYGIECAVQTFNYTYKDGQIAAMNMKKIEAYFSGNCADTNPPMTDTAEGYMYQGPISGKRYD